GCDRPPTWTEAHHLKHWQRDHGNTNIADGILLCKYHHLLLHRDGWELTHTTTTYHLIPPKNIDPQQTPIPLESKSRAWKEFITTNPDG
ncbi:MAG: endonuclease, partial [Glaciihabitans sp.]|nr:endonuclease [Glaciihabitans sp.]